MATNDANATRPRSRAKAAPAVAKDETITVRITPKAKDDLDQLVARRVLNGRMAKKIQVIEDAIALALEQELKLTSEIVTKMMKRVGVRSETKQS